MHSAHQHPILIQGGMGVGISDWRLAKSVAVHGHLGVVSGTALADVLIRRLQDGDPGHHMHRALSALPLPHIAESVLKQWYRTRGRPADSPYLLRPMYTAKPPHSLIELTLAANFVEVYLAKEGHEGPVGINYLEKVRLPNLMSLYGAMLAGVDYVLMGAGIPYEIPGALDLLARHHTAELTLPVEGHVSGVNEKIAFDPLPLWKGLPPSSLKRPYFLAIISSESLAARLMRSATGMVDGFVIETPSAGGHNAPPRGPLQTNAMGEPIYGRKDTVDLAAMRRLQRPYWLAGGYAHPGQLAQALAEGAQGIQVGTAFAFCTESGLEDSLKHQVLCQIRNDNLKVHTDAYASPTGYPFKVADVPGTVSEPGIYEKRQKICDLGYLRSPYKRDDGSLGYRCSGEPESHYVSKGGLQEETEGRKCLCNALLANIGMGQIRPDGLDEPALITAGLDAPSLRHFLSDGRTRYTAEDVIRYILG
ncbi:MAG: nitronate monooxygenase [Planctomycetota bacterium]